MTGQLTWACWGLHGDTRNEVQSLGHCLHRWPMGLELSAHLNVEFHKVKASSLKMKGRLNECTIKVLVCVWGSWSFQLNFFSPFLTASSIMAWFMFNALWSVTIVTCFPSESSMVAMAIAPIGPSVSSGGLRGKNHSQSITGANLTLHQSHIALWFSR